MWIEKLQVEIIETRNRHRIDSGGLSVNTAASSLIFHSPFVPQAKREGKKDFFFFKIMIQGTNKSSKRWGAKHSVATP